MTGDERLAILETKVEEQSRISGALLGQLKTLDEKIDKLDERFARLEAKFDTFATAVDRRFDRVEGDVKTLTTKIDNNFKWLVGINVTMWATTVAGIIVVAGLILAR